MGRPVWWAWNLVMMLFEKAREHAAAIRQGNAEGVIAENHLDGASAHHVEIAAAVAKALHLDKDVGLATAENGRPRSR